jgi:hypothetical protein
MFEAFVNPWSMVAGLLLVSVPIIIHLINRLRYKRIHWAAMEFLLKAQKRMKRKLILQQLLLLLLRCLLVALVGMLIGRFLGFSPFQGRETRTTLHTVLLDDTPSMADSVPENGSPVTAFTAAKRLLSEQMAPAMSLATNPQVLEVQRLSETANPHSVGRINATTIEELTTYLATLQTSSARGRVVDALTSIAERATSDTPDTARVVHIVSDFRSIDWELDGPALRTAIDTLAKRNVKVHMIDVASPHRKDEKKPPQASDNLGILELSPAKKVVAAFEMGEFTLRIRNAGIAEVRDVTVAISVNGDDNKGQTLAIPAIAGGQTEEIRFRVGPFDRIGTADQPLERFSIVSARISSTENGGIPDDNVRHTVVEVRPKLAILAIDGRPADRDKKEGDSFYLRNLFTPGLPELSAISNPGTFANLRVFIC